MINNLAQIKIGFYDDHCKEIYSLTCHFYDTEFIPESLRGETKGEQASSEILNEDPIYLRRIINEHIVSVLQEIVERDTK